MAIPKSELQSVVRPEIVSALAAGWEAEIDRLLQQGQREFRVDDLPRIRTPVSGAEREAAVLEAVKRYAAVGWTVHSGMANGSRLVLTFS